MAHVLVLFDVYERIAPSWLRAKATAEILLQIKYEVKNTYGLGIAPVSGPLNALALYFAEGPESDMFKLVASCFEDHIWCREHDGCVGMDGGRASGV